MPATVSHLGRPFQQDRTRRLEVDAIQSACHATGYRWRQRLLDLGVTC
jgi:hypothetical protein